MTRFLFQNCSEAKLLINWTKCPHPEIGACRDVNESEK